MTTTTTTTEEETTTTTTTTKSIVLLVKLLPEPNREEHKGLTRFQIRDPRSKCLGKTCVFRDLEPTTTTVADVKRMVERDVGEKVEMLRRGGTPEGVILEDEKTLEQCGIHRSMGVFEYLWVDSKENQEKYKEEKERMFKIIPNHEKFMEEYAKENPGRGDFDALDDEILERGAPNKDSKLLQKNNRDEEYFKDAHEIQAKVEKELDEYNAKEDEGRKKIFGDDGDGREKEE